MFGCLIYSERVDATGFGLPCVMPRLHVAARQAWWIRARAAAGPASSPHVNTVSGQSGLLVHDVNAVNAGSTAERTDC